jgi:hypothetical protein
MTSLSMQRRTLGPFWPSNALKKRLTQWVDLSETQCQANVDAAPEINLRVPYF